ncbi:MAG: FkbM family methyltransferase [Sediminibacterium sp.]|nr:FkbM family methyltransferase [Sediminibacterium sp.]
MKRAVQWVLQQILGIRGYLYWHARWQLFVQQYIYRDKELLHFLSIIPEKGIVGDIGANLGVTAVSIAKNKPLCKVVAFEPIPMNYACCRELISKIPDNRMVVYELALADCPGQLMMMIPEERGVYMHGLSKVVETPITTSQLLDVRAMSLDEIPEFALPNQVVALKIDVENFEWYVLQGAVGVIIIIRPIIFC